VRIGLNHRAVLVRTVVVGRDAARAVIHALAHRGIAQIGQMVGLGPSREGGVFHLDKIANMHLGPQLRPRPQTGKGANQRPSAHAGTSGFPINMGEGVNHRIGRNHGVANVAMRPDARACANLHLAGEDATHINLDILPTHQVRRRAMGMVTQVKTGRIGQTHALLHQPMRLALLVGTLQRGQLHGAVHTGHLHRIGNAVPHHRPRLGPRPWRPRQ
jgi:hypothetical protein